MKIGVRRRVEVVKRWVCIIAGIDFVAAAFGLPCST